MTVRTRILEAAAGLLAESPDASTRAVCDAAGVTAPTLYHYFGDKEGLLTAVVDFGWAAFLQTKRTVAAVVHEHIADDVRAGWDNHLQFARENPNFYKLMWSPAIAANSAALREAYQMLYERLELGAARGQLRVSAETAARTVMAATIGTALSLISRPDLFGDDTCARPRSPRSPSQNTPRRRRSAACTRRSRRSRPRRRRSAAGSLPGTRRSPIPSGHSCSSGSPRWPIPPQPYFPRRGADRHPEERRARGDVGPVDHHQRKRPHVRPAWPPAHRRAGDHDQAGTLTVADEWTG
jgi:AcrR family transcriptional regulator